jgi:hypothetical protein
MLAKHTGKIWSHIDLIIDGKVKQTSKRGFKVPKSMHHFNQMGTLPDDVIESFLSNVVNGLWTLKDFYEQCNRYKVVMQLRRDIIEYLIEMGGLKPGASWEDATTTFPKITPTWLETWVPAMETVAKKARVLPEGLKAQLRMMLEAAKVIRRCEVQLVFYNIIVCTLVLFRRRRRDPASTSTWHVKRKFHCTTRTASP